MKIDQIKIKQFGKAAVMFRAINAAGEVVQPFETREEAETWVAARGEIGRPWWLAIAYRRPTMNFVA